MSYQALEEAFGHPKLTISKLQQFRKEHLQNFCEVNSIDVQRKGTKEPTKAAYTTAVFNAVCHYHDPRTHTHWLPETRRCKEGWSHVIPSSRGSIWTSKANYLKITGISKGTSATFLWGELNRCTAERGQKTYQGRVYNCFVQRRMSLPWSQGTYSLAFKRPAAAKKAFLTTRDDSILIALSPILTLVYDCPYCRACVNVSMAENDEKTDQSRNIRGRFHHDGNWWRKHWLSNDIIDDRRYNQTGYQLDRGATISRRSW